MENTLLKRVLFLLFFSVFSCCVFFLVNSLEGAPELINCPAELR